MAFLKLDKIKMRTQILIVVFIIQLLIGVFIFFSGYINNTLIWPIFQRCSEKIYLQIGSNIIASNLYQNSNSILDILQINGNQLISLNQLYTKTYNMVSKMERIILIPNVTMDYGGIKPIPKILWTKDGYGGYNTTDSFLCYSNLSELHDPLTRNEEVALKIQEYYQAFGQIMYQGTFTKQSFNYGYTNTDKFNFIYPCLNRREKIFSYVPEVRDWYIDAKKLQESNNVMEYQFQITKPYLLYTEQTLGISMYSPMINEKKEFIGAFASNIYSSNFIRSFSSKLIKMVLLVGDDGMILFHDFPNVTFKDLPLKIINEPITGFSQETWDYIINKVGSSNCQNFKEVSDLPCVYNSHFQEDLLIGIRYLKKYQLNLILLYDTKKFLEFQNHQNSNINQFFQTYFYYNLLGCLLITIGILLFVTAIIFIITKPIKQIILAVSTKLQYNVSILQKLNWLDNVINSHSTFNLYIAFQHILKLFDGLSSKQNCEICQLLEKQIEFPKRNYFFNFYQNTRQSLKQIYNIEVLEPSLQRQERKKSLNLINRVLTESLSPTKDSVR